MANQREQIALSVQQRFLRIAPFVASFPSYSEATTRNRDGSFNLGELI